MKALGKITGDCLLRAAALAVAGGLLLTGCIKEDAGSCGGPDGEVTVGFRAGTLAIAGASDADDGWNVRSAKGRVQAVRSADAATRADVPPAPDPGPDVENPDDLPVGTTFRVLVYEAGADPQSDSPVDQNTYKIADAGGTIVATAVDGKGNATEGAARELVLRRGAYDFYYFSPAVPASTSMPNPGRYTGLANGADYMALAHREVIDPSQGPKHYIPEVCFYRMGSYIDVRISPRDGEIMGSLAVTGDGLQLWGLPASGSYEIGDYPYRLITEGSGGMVEFAPGDFAAEEGTTTTVSTLGTGGGRAVLPGYARDLQVKVTLTSDGKEMKLDASLAGYNFAPGYRYVVELGVGRIADKPELDIEILPWNEYDWGDDGQIGGGVYLPIDTGGGTVIEPDPKRKGTWQEAVDYCSGKGGGWRLPTENELYYYWYVEPSVNGVSPFMEGDYWSSTNNASNSGQAWTFNFSFGEARAYKKDKATSLYMRCVRDKESGAGTKYPYVKSEGNSSVIVLRDAAGGIDKASLFASRPTVTAAVAGGQHSENDRMSGMLQVQNADPGLMNWYDAIDYCDNLAQEGYDDWRMPTLRELMLIWTVGGNNNVGSLDIDNSTDSPVQRPVGSSWLHSLAGFTVLPNKVVYSATWCEEEPDLWPDIKWVMRISGTDGRVNDDGVGATSEGVRKTQAVRCVRDWDGSAPAIDTGGGGTVLEPDDPGKKVTWQQAIDYCSSKGDGWRLPTQNGLMYYWCVEPSIPAGSKFSAGMYWSATEDSSNSSNAWTVSFSNGYTYNGSAKTASDYVVRCVSDYAASAKYPYVTTASDGGVVVVLRDDNGGIDEASLFSSRVTASKTGNESSTDNRMSRKFRVQKAQSQSSTVSWSDAVSYCDNLTEEGYSDWRLPSQRELMLIWLLGGSSSVASGDKNDTGVGSASKPVNTPYIYQQSGFTAFSADRYWSATEGSLAWYVDFSNGYTSVRDKPFSHSVRCVRDEW